jgi:hypothetical protein
MAKPKGEDDVVFPKECLLVGFTHSRQLSQTADCLLPPVLQLDRVPHEYVYATDDHVLHPDQLIVQLAFPPN